MISTKNFNPKTDPKLLCTCGDSRCHQPSVNQFTLDNVQLMRDDYGKPMKITSAGRCKYHRNEKNKSKPGDHFQLYAVDIECDNPLDETRIKVLAGRHGATRVAGTYKDGFVHCAWIPTSRTDVPTWSY